MRTFCGILCLLSALSSTAANTIPSWQLYCLSYKDTWNNDMKCETKRLWQEGYNKCTTTVLYYLYHKTAAKVACVYNVEEPGACMAAEEAGLFTKLTSLNTRTEAQCIDIGLCKQKIREDEAYTSLKCTGNCYFVEGTDYNAASRTTKSSPHFACGGCLIQQDFKIAKEISDCGPINVILKPADSCTEEFVREDFDCGSCSVADKKATCFGCPCTWIKMTNDRALVLNFLCSSIGRTCNAVEKSINDEDCKAELLGRVEDNDKVNCEKIDLTYDQESKELTAELTGCDGDSCNPLPAQPDSKCDVWVNRKLTLNCAEEEEEKEGEKEEEEVTAEAAADDDITTTAATVSATSTTTPKSSVDVFSCDECKKQEHKKCNDKKDECECVDKYEDKDGTCKKKDTEGNNNGAGQQPENTTAGAALAHVTPLLLLPAAALLALVA